LNRFSSSREELIVLKANQLSIEQRILNVSVAKHLHDVKDIFCFGVFHGCFPVPERVKVDFAYAVVFEFAGDSGSLYSEGSREVSVRTI
jgi:hypothetical protein